MAEWASSYSKGSFLCKTSAAETLREYLAATGTADFLLPDMTHVLADNVLVTGIPETSTALVGLLEAFRIGVVVTLTSLPLWIPGRPESTRFATSFPSAFIQVHEREHQGKTFYDACVGARARGVQFLHLPSPDLNPVPLTYMGMLETAANAAMASGKGVWLQCFHGHFRSWSAAMVVLQRCGLAPPLDPMPVLLRLREDCRFSDFSDEAIATELLQHEPFATVRRPGKRHDADVRDVLWLLATHPEAAAFVSGRVMEERTRASARLSVDSLFEFPDYAEEEAAGSYDMDWLRSMVQWTKATLLTVP